MWRPALVGAVLALLTTPAPAGAAFEFVSAWGTDVVAGNAETGFEVCTVAASCKEANLGHLWNSAGLATDAAGDVYVAVRGRAQLHHYTASGEFVRMMGKDVVSGNAETGFEICTDLDQCAANGDQGGRGGEFTAIADVHIDAAGDIWIADAEQAARVQKLTAAGDFVLAFGKDVVDGNAETGYETCTVAAQCKTGVTGTKGGEFGAATNVTVDAGVVTVSDEQKRLQQFTTTGGFLRAFGVDVVDGNAETGFETCTIAAQCKAGEDGTGLGGELRGPADVATGAGGTLLVPQPGLRRIEQLTATGGFVRAFGKDVVAGNAETGFEVCDVAPSCQMGDVGELGGEMQPPAQVTADADGNVWVLEANSFRMQTFTPTGAFVRAAGADVVAANAETHFEVCTIAASCKTGVNGSLGGELAGASGIATGPGNTVYVTGGDNHRVEKYRIAPDPIPNGGASPSNGTPAPTPTPMPTPPIVPATVPGVMPPPPLARLPVRPSNRFTLRRARGARLQITAPGPGVLVVRGALVRRIRRVIVRAGRVTLRLRPARRALRTRRARVRVTFTPTGGTPATQTATVTL